MSEELWLISRVKDKTELLMDGNMIHEDQRKLHSTVLTIPRNCWGSKRKFSYVLKEIYILVMSKLKCPDTAVRLHQLYLTEALAHR